MTTPDQLMSADWWRVGLGVGEWKGKGERGGGGGGNRQTQRILPSTLVLSSFLDVTWVGLVK